MLFAGIIFAQQDDVAYKKRVLEASEIETLFSYYTQDGGNAAVTGGEGTEELTDATSTVVLKIPLSQDEILTIDTGLSAYTSASSSNVNPFDGRNAANAFSASSGASRSDVLAYFSPSYTHYSNDRNHIWSARAYISSEYDYFSFGFGGSYSYLFNEKNTELSLSGQVYLDSWNPQYPIEFRGGFENQPGYNPVFTPFENENRNSYSATLGFSQILSKRLQALFTADVVYQSGLLSTPFQRIYFEDAQDVLVEEFQLADDVERLPETRFKIPLGVRLNYYANDWAILRSYYRFYTDDWGLQAHTASLEVPLKLSDKFTLSPNFRYYNQTKVDYFYEKEEALSSYEFYTSDFDLAAYSANMYGVELQYKDIFTKTKIYVFGLKSVNLRYSYYKRNTGLDASIFSLATLFVID